ncbi:MAG: helix-turn-helix domain-containing protein [Candidatus Auribacterota bacterium]|nr:helix-turn-helix domain-containing protein [Candidatus Auribacterota bacterium]
MGYLGEKIKESREEQNLTLEDASLATKIKSEYLLSLEEGDYANLPPRAYVKGFLKIYARYLGIDYPLLLQLYDEEFESQDAQVIFSEPTPASPPFLPGVRWKSIAGFLGAAIVIALIVWGGIRLLESSGSTNESSISFSRVDNPYTPETIERIPLE